MTGHATEGRVAGRVSIIVPTYNSARTLHGCLASARDQTHPDVEVVVVDNGSHDETLLIARDLADRVEMSGPERSAQRNRGAAIATGEALVFVDSDQVLEPSVTAEVRAGLAADATTGALVIPELSSGQGYFAACRGLEKRVYLGDPSVEAARAFRADAFFGVGGFDEALFAVEDFDLADRVVDSGWRLGRITATVWHDEGRVRLRQVFRKKCYYGRSMARYLARPSGGCSRRLRRPSLLGRSWLLARDPTHALGLLVLKVTDGVGLGMGVVAGWPSRHS